MWRADFLVGVLFPPPIPSPQDSSCPCCTSVCHFNFINIWKKNAVALKSQDFILLFCCAVTSLRLVRYYWRALWWEKIANANFFVSAGSARMTSYSNTPSYVLTSPFNTSYCYFRLCCKQQTPGGEESPSPLEESFHVLAILTVRTSLLSWGILPHAALQGTAN